MIRAGRSTSSTVLGRIDNSSVVVLSVERFSDGWHKIVLEDGTIGYVKFNTDYLEEIDDLTNCYENKTVKNDGTILRAGPGLSQAEITTLAKGQVIARIDNSGRYNFDGNVWDRVILLDGRQGFVARRSIKDIDYTETFKISANGGLYMRNEPEGERIRSLANGSYVTRVGDPVIINGYAWEKVISQDGTIGYVAREYLRDNNGKIPNQEENNQEQNEIIIGEINNTNETTTNENGNSVNENMTNENTTVGSEILENTTSGSETVENTTNGSEEGENTTSGNNTEGEHNTTNEENTENGTTENTTSGSEGIENTTSGNQNNENTVGENNVDMPEQKETKYLVISPEKMAKDLDGIVTKDGAETEEAGTGYKIIIDGEEYTIVKRGDANGDGYVKANDYLIIKDYIIGREGTKLEGEYLQASDVTNDKAVKANDYLKIKDHIMYGVEI